ncbi:MAG: ABC transporter ATP-binding protein [Promethearchaeota archaeon]
MITINLLEVRNISKDFIRKDKTTQSVLTDISFSIKKGECFVIIGPNGCGKTTLLRILGLLEQPTKGTIIYNGKNITNLSKKKKIEYRRKFSIVRQKPIVLNTSVFNNITYGLKIREVKWEEILKRASKIIEKIGLKGMEHKNARTLSGGEMQRVAIAMNFIISPELYILDEVSANLDHKNIQFLEKFIEEIKQDKNKTIIMSTHDRLEAIKFADRIGVLNEGKLVQIGTPKEIFTSPKDEFTALFVGYENIFSGVAKIDEKTGLNMIKINNLTITASSQMEGNVKVCIRPESIGIIKSPPKNVSYRNTFKGMIEDIQDLGNICHIFVRCHSERFLITITSLSKENLALELNSDVYINFKATDVKIL